MNRLTVNKNVSEMNMIELAHNSCFAKDKKAMYRDYDTTIDTREFIRNLIKWDGLVNAEDEIFHNDDAFDDFMAECLAIDPKNKIGLIALFYRGLCAQADLYEALKRYEDLQEQGLLLKLHCKVGDIIYFPDKSINYVFPIMIAQIIISDLGEGKYCVQYNGCFFNGYGDPERDFEFEIDDFGKIVFLTQAEAEEALKKESNQIEYE